MNYMACKNDAEAFLKSCAVFKEYERLEEYEKDIVAYLMCCEWHYSKEHAEEQVRHDNDYVQKAFKNKMPAQDCALDIGYVCG